MINYYYILFLKEFALSTFLYKNNNAFTLAEVLITMGVIGVVAALTIPTLMSKAGEKQNRVSLNKYYNILSNATSLIKNDNGGTLKNLCSTNTCFKNLYKAKLSFTKECDQGDVTGKCWSSNWKTLDNNTGWNLNNVGGGTAAGLVLNDGMYMTFEWAPDNGNGACILDDEGIGNATQCFVSSVDVNGGKPPNQMGYDIFRFYVYADKVKPVGTQEQTGNIAWYPCRKSGRGDVCAAAIIANPDFVIPN